MSEITELLERKRQQVHPAPGSFERLIGLRERKRRNQRITAGALALILGLAAIGAAIRAFESGERHVPAAPEITTANVKDLGLAWSARLGGSAAGLISWVAPPVVADGSVYVATLDGHLMAFDEACGSGGATCRPTWTADVGNTIGYAPTVADGSVFITTKDGRLFEFPANCGSPCGATWVAELGGPASSSAVVSGGLVYVSDLKALYAFPVDCDVVNRSCDPVWQSLLGTPAFVDRPFVKNTIFSPVVAGDEVLETGLNGSLFAFDATTGARRWVGAPTTKVEFHYLTRRNWPVVSGNEAFAVLAGRLYAFPLDCRTDGSTCPSLWSAHLPEPYVGQPVAWRETVYVGTGQPDKPGVILAFDARSGRTVWRASEPGGDFSSIPLSVDRGSVYAPTLDGGRVVAFGPDVSAAAKARWTATVERPEGVLPVNDLVFVSSDDGRLRAFDTGCRDLSCSPVWTATTTTGFAAAPVEAFGHVYSLSTEGILRAFAIQTSAEASASRSTGSPALFYLSLLLAVLAVVIVGRVRRSRKI